jgi:hypothetical protein
LGGGDWEDHSLRTAWQKSEEDPISTNTPGLVSSPVVPVAQEAIVRMIAIQGQPRQKHETPYEKSKKGLELWLK